MLKGMLLPLDKIMEIAGSNTYKIGSNIWHSSNNSFLSNKRINIEENQGKVLELKVWGDMDNRIIYEDESRNLYYDEWFRFIGEEPQIFKLPDELWKFDL